MRLSPDSLHYGVHPTILIACADTLSYSCFFTMDVFCCALGAPADEAQPVLECLIRDGYIVQGTPPDEIAEQKLARAKINDFSDLYFPTLNLGQLANASISHGIPRADADLLVAQILESAKYINAHPVEFGGHCISQLVIFGSYLTDKQLLGDVDIGVTTAFDKSVLPSTPKRHDYNEHQQYYRKMISKLRCKKPKIVSIHDMDDVISINATFTVIYER